jgi:2-polyprenyl-6-methoxyphenol hydroxylase-like FAD-dependent oxidoreductase
MRVTFISARSEEVVQLASGVAGSRVRWRWKELGPMADIVVCGGSIIGLATAMLLARDGHRVTVLESDASPVPEAPAGAWEEWDRKGVPQFHQPHNVLSRVRQVLDEDLPGMTDALLDAGCVWVDPIASLPRFITDRAPRPGDERFRYVTGRRPVVEAVFARAADQHPNVTVRRGVAVVGLGTGASALTDVPHVDGVRLATGEELRCDLVVDAMGRRTKLAEWLDELGARPPHVESEDSGFVYYTRYFKGPEQPAMIGPPVALRHDLAAHPGWRQQHLGGYPVGCVGGHPPSTTSRSGAL